MYHSASVCILLSTYNGQKYLREQIESLLGQQGVNVSIIIRDDGSKDGTIDIISEYASIYSNITVLKEQNCGAEESYNRLCKYALEKATADFYAFSDQDDVWDEDKLEIAVCRLEKFDPQKPNLYFSNLKLVDEQLNYIRDLYKPKEVITNRSKTLVQVFTYGCTCVFNRTALKYYCRHSPQLSFHDNWIYCLCSYLGNIYYDSIAHIQYRQHGNNLSGSHSKGLSLMVTRIKRIFKGNLGHDFETMARQLLQFENEIRPTDIKLIKKVADYRKNFLSKMSLFFSNTYRSRNIIKDICIRYRIITNSL